MGDAFYNISNSTIVNRSLIQGAVTTLQARGNAESADALQKLAELVEQSGQAEAGELLDTFTEELQRSSPRRSVLQSIWDSIQDVLPTVSTMLQITEGIEKLLS